MRLTSFVILFFNYEYGSQNSSALQSIFLYPLFCWQHSLPIFIYLFLFKIFQFIIYKITHIFTQFLFINADNFLPKHKIPSQHSFYHLLWQIPNIAKVLFNMSWCHTYWHGILSFIYIEYIKTLFIFLTSMEQLNRLIKDASNQFECHNFQTALALYVRCIQKCEKQGLPAYVLHNLKSSQAAIRAILGEQQIALSILNEVLQKDKQHWACLMRRSQIYKKQNKLKKSMKDLQILSMYAPDNMQIAAFKLQLKTLMNKNSDDSFDQESSQDECMDEEKSLVFSGLKKIDRCSVSIMLPKGRQSRVTITGDKSYFYQSDSKVQKGPKQSLMITPHFIRKKFIQVQEQLEQTGDSQQSQSPVVIVKSKPTRTKSILRNRDSAIYVSDKKSDNLISTVEGKKLIQKLQNIQGSIIGSEHGSMKNCSQKQVQFRKSSVQQDPQKFVQIKIKKSAGRKSCLKRPSFTATEDLTKNPEGRRRSSKFETLSRESIDGKIIKSDKKKISIKKEASKQNMRMSNEGDSADQSESGSQFNIFGTKKPVLNESLKQNLGFGSDEIMEIQVPQKKTKGRTSSILKKTSILVSTPKNNKKMKEPSIFFRQSLEDQPRAEKKAKKSVMFTTC